MRGFIVRLLMVLVLFTIWVGQPAWAGPAAGPTASGPGEVSAPGDGVPVTAPLGKWFPSYWFLDARIRLVWTGGWITIPTGYWGGWYWWHDPCCWLRPWQGPLQWYWPYCYNYPYVHYWNYWPYYRCYLPWWHYWDWRGWPWFWSFRDSLTYRYGSWKPVVVYYWRY